MFGILDAIKGLFEADQPEIASSKGQTSAACVGDQAAADAAPSERAPQQGEALDLGTILDSASSFLGSSSEEE